MTLLGLLRGLCFFTPPVMVINFVGKSAGAVGIIVGLLAGGLGSYTLKWTDDYTYSLYERREPGIVKEMLDRAIFICFGMVILNFRLHLTACGTLAADWCPGSEAAGDEWRWTSLPTEMTREEFILRRTDTERRLAAAFGATLRSISQ